MVSINQNVSIGYPRMLRMFQFSFLPFFNTQILWRIFYFIIRNNIIFKILEPKSQFSKRTQYSANFLCQASCRISSFESHLALLGVEAI